MNNPLQSVTCIGMAVLINYLKSEEYDSEKLQVQNVDSKRNAFATGTRKRC